MSYYDDRMAEIAARPCPHDEPTATSEQRGLFGVLTLVGIGLCFTPIAVLGVGMVLAFGLLWLCAPVVAKVEAERIEETRETGGVGKFIQTVMLILFFGALALCLAVGAMLVMMGGK